MKVALIVGSPRINGKSAKIADLLEKHFRFEYPEAEVERFDVADMDITGCNGCDYCLANDTCVMSDDEDDLLDFLEFEADQVYLVSPIYFSGVPSQEKALLDRFQPYFWKRIELLKKGGQLPAKKPLKVYLVGDSLANDPYGYEPALTTIKSAFAVVNYQVVAVHPFVGKTAEITFETVLV